jgi:hypothetical protein
MSMLSNDDMKALQIILIFLETYRMKATYEPCGRTPSLSQRLQQGQFKSNSVEEGDKQLLLPRVT